MGEFEIVISTSITYWKTVNGPSLTGMMGLVRYAATPSRVAFGTARINDIPLSDSTALSAARATILAQCEAYVASRAPVTPPVIPPTPPIVPINPDDPWNPSDGGDGWDTDGGSSGPKDYAFETSWDFVDSTAWAEAGEGWTNRIDAWSWGDSDSWAANEMWSFEGWSSGSELSW